MATVDKEEWEKVNKVENEKMIKYNVFEVMNKEDVPARIKMMDFSWATKGKKSGVDRARLAIRGF